MTVRLAALALAACLAVLASWLLPRAATPPDRFSRALELLEEDRGEEAAVLFEDAPWRGVAEYRAERFRHAAGEFFQDGGVRGLYNLGNAYARLHEWGGAKQAYRKALALDPGHADARHNLAVVERAEAREQEMLDEQRATSREGRRRFDKTDGEGERQAGGGEEGDKTEKGGTGGERERAARSRTPVAGRTDTEGVLGDKPVSRNAMAGRAGGRAAEDARRDLRGGGGSARMLAESAQEAEILLRRIVDNPAKVLAARLETVHRRRREEAER